MMIISRVMKIVRMISTILHLNSDDDNDSDDNTIFTITMRCIMIKEIIIKIIMIVKTISIVVFKI